MDSELIQRAKGLAEEIFSDQAFLKRPFHNLAHTIEVVDAVTDVGRQSDLSDDEMESALVAAWLHDVGYKNGKENHEALSIKFASDLLESMNASPQKIRQVADAISSTKLPQQPKTMVDKVLCDADLYHLSTDEYQAKGSLLRDELAITGVKTVSDEEWVQYNLDFLENHRYQTPYGKSVLEESKRKNIKRLRKYLEPEISKKKYKKLQEEVVKLRSKLEKTSVLKPDRGIETMFRTTSHNHVMLSQMVDSKASILITINSIILSLIVSVLIRKLEENEYLLIPTILLISVCLATMVFSILASRPNVSSGKFTSEDIKSKRTNLLFFGNFHGMNVEDYEWGMKEMMKDADYLYGSLIKDIYYLGKVLGKKYQHLRIAYSIFMYGFVVAILSFIVAFQLSAKGHF